MSGETEEKFLPGRRTSNRIVNWEMMLLGNITILTQEHNTILEWDAEDFEFTNLDEANRYLKTDYSDGWSLD